MMLSTPGFPRRFYDEVTVARKVALDQAHKAAANFDGLAGSLLELEKLTSPFFIGLDNDPDDSYLAVWP